MILKLDIRIVQFHWYWYQLLEMYYCDNLIQNYSYTIIKEAYHSVPRAALGLSDHCLVHLIPTYRQKLKAAKPVTRTGKSSYKAVILSQKKEAQRLKCLSKKLLDLSSSRFFGKKSLEGLKS